MGKRKLTRFHTFRIPKIATLILIEPKKKEFIWCYFYLHPEMRNGAISAEIIQYLLYHLKGNHHIHWLKHLKVFKQLSKELKWIPKQESDIFEGCYYSKAYSTKSEPKLYPLFKNMFRHSISRRKPTLLKFKTKKDEDIIFSLIEKLAPSL